MRNLIILVAEDDEDDRFLFESAISEKGLNSQLEFVGNGVELMQYLENIPQPENPATTQLPGFILLDLNMPKKDGREVLRELKDHPIFKKIPVIIFTTTNNEMEINRCYELGANTYIVKPASFDGLLQVVENLHQYWFRTATIPVS
jgi:CheY-like chemotaxis protein